MFEILSNDKLKLKKSEPNHGSSKLLAERLVVLSSLIYKCVKPVGAADATMSINDLKNELKPLEGLEGYPFLQSISDEKFKTLYNNGINNFIYSDSILEPNSTQNSTTTQTATGTQQLNQFP